MSQQNAAASEEFVRLITAYQPRIYAFILSMLPNSADADEVSQETSLTLWERFHEFVPGTDFRAWAFQVAFYKVRQFRTYQQRAKLQFGQEFLEKLARVAVQAPDNHNARQDALMDCLGKLSSKDKQLLAARCEDGASVEIVSQQLGRSRDAVYKALQRLRHSLHDCIDRRLRSEGGL